jgi:hypothetical protein
VSFSNHKLLFLQEKLSFQLIIDEIWYDPKTDSHVLVARFDEKAREAIMGKGHIDKKGNSFKEHSIQNLLI